MNIKTERVVTLVYKAGIWLSLPEMALINQALATFKPRFDTNEERETKKLLSDMIDIKRQATYEIAEQRDKDIEEMPKDEDVDEDKKQIDNNTISIRDINKDIAKEMRIDKSNPDCEPCD